MDKIREARLETVARFLTLLARENVPPHIQEVLCYGDAQLGVKPGALERALSSLPSCEGWREADERLLAFVARYIDNPNLTPAEKVSAIRNHPIVRNAGDARKVET